MAYQESPDIETSSEEYARRFAGSIGEWFLKVQSEATLRMIAPYHKATVLDIGGGHGQLVEPLIMNGYKVTVLGSSEVCRNKIMSFIENNLCEFNTGDMLNIPYDDRSFDIAISFRQLPHVINWKRFISELTRVAKKAVIVDFPSLRSLNYINHIIPGFFKLKKGLEADTRPYTLFRESELLEVFSVNKFIYAERFPQFILPMFLHRKLRLPMLSVPAERIFRLFGITGVFGSPIILKLVRANGS
jgi:2-polyprenyl-3-methyl-5-hydroxy-6-metoxy-1,4-benzoquinol methylase